MLQEWNNYLPVLFVSMETLSDYPHETLTLEKKRERLLNF